jgi:predicted deacetylase
LRALTEKTPLHGKCDHGRAANSGNNDDLRNQEPSLAQLGASREEMSRLSGAEKAFIVSVHDVEPRFLPELSAIVEALHARIGATMSAAVVAEPAEKSGCSEFVSLVRENFQEIALHGYSHRSKLMWHPISLLTRGANEFSKLPAAEAQDRLRRGQIALSGLFGAPARVFVPPAWCRGAVTVNGAAREGFSITVTLRHLLTAAGKIPVATHSWDCGRVGVLGYASEWIGRLLAGIPCITMHPADVRRGFLTRGLRRVDRLLNAGCSPITFESYVSNILKEAGLFAG